MCSALLWECEQRERAGVLPFSVMMTSVCELPYLCMWSTASCMLSTTSMQHSKSPYSVRRDFTSEGLKVRYDANLGPACIFTCISPANNNHNHCSDTQFLITSLLIKLEKIHSGKQTFFSPISFTSSVLSRSMIWSKSGVRSTSL